MTDKHLRKGDKNPLMSKGKLRLYSMRFCPFAQRVHLVLDAKNIPYDVVNIDLGDKPEFLFEINPSGKVPALETEEGDCIYESLILVDYLDEKFPQTPLHSKDPMKKAKDRILVELFNKIPPLVFKFYKITEREIFDAVMNELDLFEKELQSRKTTFYGGETPGMLDFMIWPWGQRIDVQKDIEGDQFELPQERFPKLKAWLEAMKADVSVRKSYVDPEGYGKYIHRKRSGASGPDLYDVLLE